MNQGKVDVVKEQMARVNINILGREWVNLIQMNIISTTMGKNLLEKMEQPS